MTTQTTIQFHIGTVQNLNVYPGGGNEAFPQSPAAAPAPPVAASAPVLGRITQLTHTPPRSALHALRAIRQKLGAKCETCRGSRLVFLNPTGDVGDFVSAPCPDCAQTERRTEP